MSAEKLYFGIKNVPKGYKRANAQQALENSQVRYWGVNKIDSRLLSQPTTKKKNNKKLRDETVLKVVGLRGRIAKLQKDIEYEKNTSKKKELKAELTKTINELNQTVKILQKFDE